MEVAEILSLAGIVLIFVGLAIVVISILLKSVRSSGKANVRGGGAVIIGPVPIVFGTDKKMVRSMLILAIVLTLLVLTVTVVNYLLTR
jgi:uncharacterized protein (TIGR00304 family)